MSEKGINTIPKTSQRGKWVRRKKDPRKELASLKISGAVSPSTLEEMVEINEWGKGSTSPMKKLIPIANIIVKLEQAFSLGCNITEACCYAGIHRNTYHIWVKQKPELKERFEELQQNPILLAKQRAVTGIMESYGNAMDYLKRVRPNEFGDKALNVHVAGDRMILLFSEDELKDIEQGKKKYVDGKVIIDEGNKK